MSSGTYVKVERYYNRHHYKSIEEIDENIMQATKDVAAVWADILSMCVATPKDITPTNEEPMLYVTERLKYLRECLEDAEYKLQALHDIKDGWETREED